MSSVLLLIGCLFLFPGAGYLAYSMHGLEAFLVSLIVLDCVAALTSVQSARRSRV